MAREIQPIVFQGWPGGLNLTKDPLHLEPDELSKLTNATLGLGGELIQRKGGEAKSLFDPADGTYDWLFHHFPPGHTGEPYLVIFKEETNVGGAWHKAEWIDYNGNFIEDAGGSLSPMVLGEIPSWPYMYWPQAVVMNTNVYLCRGKVNGNCWELVPDPSGGFNEANSLTPWDLSADTTTDFPPAGTLMVAYERIFAANIDEGSFNTNDRLYFSEPLEPLEWKTTNYIDIAPDQGQAITKLVFMGDQIVVFKESSIHGISGRDFTGVSDLEVYEIDGGLGCGAPATVVKANNGLIFVDPNRGIFMYDGSGFHNVGEKVWDTIHDLLGVAVPPDRMVAWYHDGYYWLRVGGDAGHGTYAMDLRTGAWTHHTIEARWAETIIMADETVVIGAHPEFTHLQLMYEDTPLDPDGSVVTMEFEFAISPGAEAIQSRLQGVEATITPAYTDSFVPNSGTTFGIEFREQEADAAFAEDHFRFTPTTDERVVVKTHVADQTRWRSLFVSAAVPTWSDATDPDRRVAIPNVRAFVSSYPRRRRENTDATVVGSTGS